MMNERDEEGPVFIDTVEVTIYLKKISDDMTPEENERKWDSFMAIPMTDEECFGVVLPKTLEDAEQMDALIKALYGSREERGSYRYTFIFIMYGCVLIASTAAWLHGVYPFGPPREDEFDTEDDYLEALDAYGRGEFNRLNTRRGD